MIAQMKNVKLSLTAASLQHYIENEIPKPLIKTDDPLQKYESITWIKENTIIMQYLLRTISSELYYTINEELPVFKIIQKLVNIRMSKIAEINTI